MLQHVKLVTSSNQQLTCLLMPATPCLESLALSRASTPCMAGAKFGWCGFSGRDDLYFKVTANTTAFIAAAAPSWITPTVSYPPGS
jgi:hypothetical protein